MHTLPYTEYSGMSYEQASREADRLIKTYGWFSAFNRLKELHMIMRLSSPAHAAAQTETPAQHRPS